jgi:uncharacterized membrane protein YesL
MFSIDGKLYRLCTWISNFAFLNLLFLISCIPVITIFPAAAALFAVVRQLVKNNEITIFKNYWLYFAKNFKQSFLIGIFSACIGLFLFVDFRIIDQMQPSLKSFLFSSLVAITIYFILFLLCVFPLMVNSYYTTKQLIVNAFTFSLYKPHLTLLTLIGFSAIVLASLKWTFLLVFFTCSFSAYLTYWFAERKFSSLESHSVKKESLEINAKK